MIPRTIYQTWYTKNIPLEIQKDIDLMKINNPVFNYSFFDDNMMRDFVQTNFSKQILGAYDMLNIGAAKADLWRYLILYKNGGVYLDIDSVWQGSFDELITDDDCGIVSREANTDIFVQWCLIFGSKHPILEYAIEKACKNIYSKLECGLNFLTGPAVFSEAVNKILDPIKIYNMTDSEANELINKPACGNKKCRVFSTDYKPHGIYKHALAESLLYREKPYWQTEQQNGIYK